MPPRLCCCGCKTFDESWVRDGDDETLLEDHWEACGLWTDWSIGAPSPGSLVNNVANAKIVLKEMYGNPYGILKGKVYGVLGTIFRVYVFHGTQDNPCSGSGDLYVEMDFSEGDGDGFLRIKQGSTVLEETEFTAPTDELEFLICVGKNALEASIESSNVIRHCGTPTGYYFALESVGIGQEWGPIRYEDHFNHNPSCKKCGQPCCFPGFDQVVYGFHVRITGFEDNNCNCTDPFEFDVFVPPNTDMCQCELQFYTDPNSDPPDQTIAGPHNCDSAESTVQISLSCDGENINIGFDLLMDYAGEGEVNFNPKSFPVGTAPEGITFNDMDVLFANDNLACNTDNLIVEMTPYVQDGCCTEDTVEAPTALAESVMSELPLEPCTFLEENKCGLVSMTAGQDISVTPDICKACTLCPRPRRLNEVTMMLIPDDDIRNKVAETILKDEGVGTDLAKVFGMFVDTNMACGCNGLRDMLNTWTIQQIRANKSVVVGRIYAEAQKRNIPVMKKVISGLLEAILLKNTLIG